MSKLYFHEFTKPFYKKLGLDYHSKLVHGQLCKAIVHYCYENEEIWRPITLDSSGTFATAFQIEAKPGDAYKSNRLLHTPALRAYEEFPVVRAKQRPVIVISPPREQIGTKDVGGPMRINKKLVTVAPCYSLSDEMGNAKLDASFIQRVDMLEFEHFMFLPGEPPLDRDSLLRLDSIAHVFHPHIEPTQFALSDNVWSILSGQLERLFRAGSGKSYTDIRQLLMTQ